MPQSLPYNSAFYLLRREKKIAGNIEFSSSRKKYGKLLKTKWTYLLYNILQQAFIYGLIFIES